MSQPDGPFHVELTGHADAASQLHAVRDAVFVREQQVPAELEHDGLDPACTHALARDRHGSPIGTAHITAEGRIGRMAVLPEWRGHGVGSALLQALLRHARGHGLTRVVLHAQAAALDFYLAHGFEPAGEAFMEAGIEHRTMQLALDRPRTIERREQAIQAVAELARAARRRLWIYSRELDPGLLDAPSVIAALRAFAVRGRDAQVRILLQEPAAPQRAGAPLLMLAQRLPSAFAFRAVEDPVDRSYAAAFVANDTGGYYHRNLGHRFDGEWEPDGGGRARQLVESFKPVWERARHCSEYRALGL